VSRQLHPRQKIRRYALKRRLDGPQKWQERFDEDKNNSWKFNNNFFITIPAT